MQSTTGHVTLLAAQDVTLNAAAEVITGGAGTLTVTATAGAVTMNVTSHLTAGAGDVRVTAATDVVVGGLVSTTGNVSLTATAGSILDADTDGSVDVVANQLRLVAGTGVGQLGGSVNPIETTVAVVSARATGGGVNLLEANGLTVGDTSATVQQVNADATVTAVTDATQSDLVTTAGNGSIVLRSTTGSLTLANGTAPTDNVALSAHGLGNVLVQALADSGSLTLNADVLTGGGHLTLEAGLNLVLAATADARVTGAGTVNAVARTGSVTQADDSRLVSTTGDVRVRAQVNLVLGGVTTGGNVSLTAVTGSILDAGSAFGGEDIIAAGLRLDAGVGAGVLGGSNDPLETAVSTVTGRATSGGLNLLESDAITVGTVSVTVSAVNADGSTASVTDAAQAGLVTTVGNGAIVLRNQSGAVTVNNVVSAHGTGNVLLSAATAVTLNADVSSGSGHVSGLAGQGVTFAAGVVVRTTGGTVDLAAQAGNVVMTTTSRIESAGGNIRVSATGDVLVGVIDTRVNGVAGGAVSVVAGGLIYDAGVGAAARLFATDLRLQAGTGVGGEDAREYRVEMTTNLRTWTTVATVTSTAATVSQNVTLSGGMAFYRVVSATGAAVTVSGFELLGGGQARLTWARSGAAGGSALEVEAATLTAQAGSRGVSVVESTGVTVGTVGVSVNRVQADGSVSVTTDAAQRGVTTSNDGAVLVRTLAGSLTVADAVSAGGSGNVRLAAEGAGTDLILNANVTSGTGHMTLRAARHLNLNANVQTAGAGTVNLEAVTGALTMNAGSVVTNASGSQRLAATGNVTLGTLTTQGNVSLVSGGSISADTITAVGLRVNAVGDVGVLATTVTTLSARGAGVNVLEADGLSVGDVAVSVQRVNADNTLTAVSDAAQGDVVGTGVVVLRSTTGALALNDGANADGVAVRAGGNLLVQANSGDVNLNADLRSTGGAVSVLAAGDLRQSAAIVADAGTVDLQADGSVRMSAGARVQTNGANVRIVAGVDVEAGVIDTRTTVDRTASQLTGQNAWGDVSLTATTGLITDADATGDAVVDVFARAVRLSAATGVGTPNPLEIEVTTLAAAGGSGGVRLVDPTALSVGTVNAVSVSRVQGDGTTLAAADAGDLTGVRKTGGTLDVDAQGGTGTVGNLPAFQVITTFTAGSLPSILTGLFEQTLEVSNPTGSSIDAVRVLIGNLPAGVRVANASGSVNGVAYVQLNRPLGAGETVRLIVEYSVPLGTLPPLAPTFLVEAVDALPAVTPVGSVVTDGFRVSRTPGTAPTGDRALVEWNSLLNRTYYVQTSADGGTTWSTVLSPVTGTGARVVWLDNGPPKTNSDSAGLTSRMYRVILESLGP